MGEVRALPNLRFGWAGVDHFEQNKSAQNKNDRPEIPLDDDRSLEPAKTCFRVVPEETGGVSNRS